MHAVRYRRDGLLLQVCVSLRVQTGPMSVNAYSNQTWNSAHFATERPNDPGIQRPGDPVDPVSLFYNELQMSSYVLGCAKNF